LQSFTAQTEEQTARMFVIQNRLCELYATMATAPHPRPSPSGIALPSLALQQIAIGPEDIIADFSLPYLSTCDCDCSEIPTPTADDLGIPSVILPAFFEYNLGDYAFAKDIVASTYGCSTITQLSIDISTHINYIGERVGSGSVVKVTFIKNGADNPVITGGDKSVAPSVSTEHGGRVIVTEGNGVIQGFSYTPPRNFSGLDTFQYVFQAFDSHGNVIRRSTIATVIISVTSRCPAVAPVAVSAGFEPIAIG
jgi:hypothetical protein